MSWLFSLFLSLSIGANAQSTLKNGTWRATILREDGNQIVFNLDVDQKKGKTVFYVVVFNKDTYFSPQRTFNSLLDLNLTPKTSRFVD